MNIYSAASLLAFITCTLLCFLILIKGKQIAQNRIFSLATFLTGTWCLFPFLSAVAKNDSMALYYTRVIYIYAAFVPSVWLTFIFELADQTKSKKKILIFAYTSSIIWSLISFNQLFISKIVRFAPNFYLIPGPLYIVFILYFSVLNFVIVMREFETYHRMSGYKKNQFKYIIAASLISIIGAILHFSAIYTTREPIPHDFFIAIFPCIIAYAILKHRLMDISLTITRTGIFVGVYTLVLGLPFVLAAYGKTWLLRSLGGAWWLGPLVLGAALATVGPFIYIYFQKRAEAILLREQRRYQETLKRVGLEMTRIHNLNKLLNFLVDTICGNARISHSAIYLSGPNDSRLFLKAGHNIRQEQPASISLESALTRWLKSQNEILVYEEVKRRSEENPDPVFKNLEEEMRDLNATIIVPHFLEDKLLGVLMLGDKESGKIYTSEDLHVFSVLATQSALAIENALLYENIEEQVKQRTEQLVDVQKQLIQAEKMATVGTLAGGVAHEINNPLSVILTNVQMLLAENSAKSGLDKESLAMIEEATKRCRTIVQKLMVYAKKPMESSKVSEVDLLAVVNNIVGFLRYQLEQENIAIAITAPQDHYTVVGNQNELEQVIGNIIINARDAIKQVKKKGCIDVSLAKDDNRIRVEVKDEGSGISKDVLPRIFDPFFTTKDVGKGLGLGLSICQSIIEKHMGTIAVRSESGRGSVFTIQFPQAKI